MSATEQYEEKRRQQVSTARSIMNYVMGVVFTLMGIGFLYVYFSRTSILSHDASLLDLLLAALLLFYGIWRIYRGYKKNYFNE